MYQGGVWGHSAAETKKKQTDGSANYISHVGVASTDSVVFRELKHKPVALSVIMLLVQLLGACLKPNFSVAVGEAQTPRRLFQAMIKSAASAASPTTNS